MTEVSTWPEGWLTVKQAAAEFKAFRSQVCGWAMGGRIQAVAVVKPRRRGGEGTVSHTAIAPGQQRPTWGSKSAVKAKHKFGAPRVRWDPLPVVTEPPEGALSQAQWAAQVAASDGGKAPSRMQMGRWIESKRLQAVERRTGDGSSGRAVTVIYILPGQTRPTDRRTHAGRQAKQEDARVAAMSPEDRAEYEKALAEDLAFLHGDGIDAGTFADAPTPAAQDLRIEIVGVEFTDEPDRSAAMELNERGRQALEEYRATGTMEFAPGGEQYMEELMAKSVVVTPTPADIADEFDEFVTFHPPSVEMAPGHAITAAGEHIEIPMPVELRCWHCTEIIGDIEARITNESGKTLHMKCFDAMEAA